VVELGKLEQALHRLQMFVSKRRLESLCVDLRLTSARYKAVPSHYYTLSYEQRVELIGTCVRERGREGGGYMSCERRRIHVN
jgi:hypothetical protein